MLLKFVSTIASQGLELLNSNSAIINDILLKKLYAAVFEITFPWVNVYEREKSLFTYLLDVKYSLMLSNLYPRLLFIILTIMVIHYTKTIQSSLIRLLWNGCFDSIMIQSSVKGQETPDKILLTPSCSDRKRGTVNYWRLYFNPIWDGLFYVR